MIPVSFGTISLGEVCDFLYGDSLPEVRREEGPVPVYGSNGEVGWHNQSLTSGPTIIIGRKGSIGKVHFSKQPCFPIDTTYYIERTKREADLKWLYYLLISLNLTDLNKSAAVPGLNREDAYEKRIVFPPLEEQKRIAWVLGKCDRIRRTRRYTQQLSDTYLQSVFLEMFGNALKGDTEIPLVPLAKICTKITDGTHHTPKYQSKGVSFLSVKNLTREIGKLDFDDTKFITVEEHRQISRRCKVEQDDVLYTKVGVSYGIPQIVETDIEFSIFVSLALLKPDKSQIIPKYLEAVLRTDFTKSQADKLVSGIGVPDLHLREIKTIEIPLPDLSLQRQFAEIAAKYDRIRTQQHEATRQAEHLFQTTLHRAFRGEL